MFKRLLRTKNENVMAVDSIVDTPLRTRSKPSSEDLGVARKKGDGAVMPFAGDENAQPTANATNTTNTRKGKGGHGGECQEGGAFDMDSVFRLSDSKYTEKFFDNPLLKARDAAHSKTEGVRVTVSKRKLASSRKKGGDDVSDSGSTAAVRALAAAEAKTAAEWTEEHKGDDDDDDEEENEAIATATASSNNKRRRVSFSGATAEGGGVDARFASTRSAMGGTAHAHAHAHAHTHTQRAGGTITTPMSTRKKARLEKDAMADVSFSGLEQEQLEELFSRVRHNRSKVVERTLSGGADPDARDGHGNTMLHVAAQNNLLKMAEVLIGFGADPSLPNRKGFTPLAFAHTYKFPKLAAFLQSMGAE